MQVLTAPNLDLIRSGPTDISPHRIQEISQIHNMRFPSRIFNHSSPLGLYSRQHNIDGGPNGNYIQIYAASTQILCSHIYHAAFQTIGGAQS